MRAPTTLLESANREKCPTPYQSASKRLAQQAVKWEFQEPQVLLAGIGATHPLCGIQRGEDRKSQGAKGDYASFPDLGRSPKRTLVTPNVNP